MLSSNYVFALLAATSVIANPITVGNNETSILETRSGHVFTCNYGDKNEGDLAGKPSQDKSIGFARLAGTKTGASGYPMKFDNKGDVMKFAKGCNEKGTEIWELPIRKDGKQYDINKKKDGNNPGPMRIYYTKNDIKFCAIGNKRNKDNTGNPHNCAP